MKTRGDEDVLRGFRVRGLGARGELKKKDRWIDEFRDGEEEIRYRKPSARSGMPLGKRGGDLGTRMDRHLGTMTPAEKSPIHVQEKKNRSTTRKGSHSRFRAGEH